MQRIFFKTEKILLQFLKVNRFDQFMKRPWLLCTLQFTKSLKFVKIKHKSDGIRKRMTCVKSFNVIYGKVVDSIKQSGFVEYVNNYFDQSGDEGTLYLGYPLTANAEKSITVDALLVGKHCGVVVFVFSGQFSESLNDVYDEQDEMIYQLDYYFRMYPTLRLKGGRGLFFDFRVVSILPVVDFEFDSRYSLRTVGDVAGFLKEGSGLDDNSYHRICEALQKVTGMKPVKERKNVSKENSMGNKIREIEKQIANLDFWQQKAAMEIPDGPQRIRGLAGSGKTIVLAWKVAYLHAQFPDWNIAITFYTRSLAQQLKKLIRQYYLLHARKEPDWEKVFVIHAWGSVSEDGFYSMAARSLHFTPVDYGTAVSKYERKQAFSGVCSELLPYFGKEYEPFFDAVLIDEAQDMPAAFFKLVYNLTKKPKRITWAYDELQNLSDVTMPSVEEMFELNEENELSFTLQNRQGEAMRDIILPICYRNPMWSLSVAHALGFGIYRKPVSSSFGIVQMFDSPEIWEDIGYDCVGGELSVGKEVILKRSKNATPDYFERLLTSEECLIFHSFDSVEAQYLWVSEEIFKNITIDELDADDILVVFVNSLKVSDDYIRFRKFLLSKGISSILVGVDTGKDIFRVKNSVSCSSIYRAKGNEAPMVYIVNADYCAQSPDLIKRRNILFTAITRSRAWVRLLGTGSDMNIIVNEMKRCMNNDYRLQFRFPTQQELSLIRRIHRERTDEEIRLNDKANRELENIKRDLEKNKLDVAMLSNLEELFAIYQRKKMDA